MFSGVKVSAQGLSSSTSILANNVFVDLVLLPLVPVQGDLNATMDKSFWTIPCFIISGQFR